MARTIPAEKWTAVRQLRELEPPTFNRLSAASGIHRTSICDRAAREGWKPLECRPAKRTGAADGAEELHPTAAEAALAELGSLESPEERHAWLNAYLARSLRAIAASGRGLDKPQIDALTALTRLIEKSEALAKERAAHNETRSDDELAELLSFIDARIVELAEARADWLVGRRTGGLAAGDGAAGTDGADQG